MCSAGTRAMLGSGLGKQELSPMGGGPGNLWGDLTAKGDEHAEESNETVVNAPGPVVPAALTLLLGQPLPWGYVSPLCLWLQEAHPSPPLLTVPGENHSANSLS